MRAITFARRLCWCPVPVRTMFYTSSSLRLIRYPMHACACWDIFRNCGRGPLVQKQRRLAHQYCQDHFIFFRFLEPVTWSGCAELIAFSYKICINNEFKVSHWNGVISIKMRIVNTIQFRSHVSYCRLFLLLLLLLRIVIYIFRFSVVLISRFGGFLCFMSLMVYSPLDAERSPIRVSCSPWTLRIRTLCAYKIGPEPHTTEIFIFCFSPLLSKRKTRCNN